MSGHDMCLITSPRNRRVAALRRLDDKKHRQRSGQFLVEGLQALRMALDAGLQPHQAFYCTEMFAGPEAPALLRRMERAGAEAVPVTPEVMRTLVDRDLAQGLVATFPLFAATLATLQPSGQELYVVLDRVRNGGNIGMLVRAADAAGAGAVILLEPCADALGPEAVRGSMGSVFNLPLVHTSDAKGLFAWLHGHGLRSVAADPHRGAAWGEGVLTGGVALVLGNEGRGLSDDVRAEVQAWARLPMRGRADSLNVGMAGGILMYTWLRLNSAALR